MTQSGTKPATDQQSTLGNVSIHGSGTVAGGEYHDIDIHGSASIQGEVTCTRYIVHGSSTVRGAMHAKRVNIYGSADILGSLYGEDVQIKGRLITMGDCVGRNITGIGSLDVGGKLIADTIRIGHHGRSRIEHIECASIQVRQPRGSWFFKHWKQLTVGTIASTSSVHLEYTDADLVKGHNVYIGKGCNIERIEYSGEYHKDPRAIVVEAVKV